MPSKTSPPRTDPLAFAGDPVRTWFTATFDEPTPAQTRGWPVIAGGRSALILAPTGSGKTLAAFLAALDRLMFGPPPAERGTRVLYISPLKALGVDVERNLRAPLAGIRNAAELSGTSYRLPAVGVRSGDTSPAERRQMLREPPEILITTPESLYLMLTSRAGETLRQVETVIVDEIHTMVAGKRGAHLFLSLERLEALRRDEPPMQRIGLSATQRPLEEVGRLLAGYRPVDDPAGLPQPRPVEIIDAGSRKRLELTVEVPVEDMARLGDEDEVPHGPAAGVTTRSIWPSIHPRLLELVREHRSTMIFVNSRRLAERLAAALNELSGDEIALAHHGSIAKDRRAAIEDRLKSGTLPAIVATSSLELGIDMGAVDLVIQIEAPPSVASGMQRIGRAGHQVSGVSRGVVFPKFRADLLASAAATALMRDGRVESTAYPRNPLDVLAQQIVAMVSRGPVRADELYRLVRGAAPFADLPRRSFDGVLDMLSGLYPSERFAGLRPRLTWDRVGGLLHPRGGAQSVAIINGGTIPDRGLFGVFLSGAESGKPVRVGELDEEMVFEARSGDVFLLGASTWRIDEITHDRVLVTPAPGEQPKMPFWKGDRPGRPLDFGRAIGALSRRLLALAPDAAARVLRDEHHLDARAAANLVAYLGDQEAASAVPTDRRVVLERFVDEVGDWRVTLLSPFGGRVHAPWATAVMARLRKSRGVEVDSLWSDDGIVFRLPESDAPPEDSLFFPAPDELEDLVVRQLADTPLFAAHFRENAARALLLPRRRPGERTPLWVQRRRSSDLLDVASDFPDFPMVLETYRECLRDVFDLTGLHGLLADVAEGRIDVQSIAVGTPSPFAASLLYAWVASFMYEGDAPLAERRATVLSLDHAHLRELLGEPDLREMLDGDIIAAVEARLQRRDDARPLRHADDLHDVLLALGDLDRAEIGARAGDPDNVDTWLDELLAARRVIGVRIAGEARFAAAEDAGLLRDALGVTPPRGLPAAFLREVEKPLERLARRWSRYHAPFRAEDLAARYGLGVVPAQEVLGRLVAAGDLLQGGFLPGGDGLEYCHPDTLREVKQRTLARLRRQVEPVGTAAFGKFLADWHRLHRRRRGADGLVDIIEQLQGAPLPVSDLERRILPARLEGDAAPLLDELCATGEVVWRGMADLPPGDGRIALYLREHYPTLAPSPVLADADGDTHRKITEHLACRGASFFPDLLAACGGFPPDVLAALWDLVWAGQVTNDTLAPLRSRLRAALNGGRRGRGPRGGRSRRGGPPGSGGRWSLLPALAADADRLTAHRAALARQLLERHGVLTREAVQGEGLAGGFAAVYPVLKAMEDAGQVRRGYFVAGLGATQFARPGADDRLRLHVAPADDETRSSLRLAATDPASPWGAAVRWPEAAAGRPARAAGNEVIVHDGRLVGHLNRAGDQILTFLAGDSPEREAAARAVAAALAAPVRDGERRAVLLRTVDGGDPANSGLAEALTAGGFAATRRGWLLRERDLHG